MNLLFAQKYKINNELSINKSDKFNFLLENRLNEALSMFSTQPKIWIDPILNRTNEISYNPDDNFNNRINIEEIINDPKSTIIKAPPQFGLTCLSHFLVLEAWKKNKFWIYLDGRKIKTHNIYSNVKNEVCIFGRNIDDIECIIIDSWNCFDNSAYKKLQKLCDEFTNIPIIVMQTIDDSKFLSKEKDSEEIVINREFDVLNLLALPRNEIRKVVSEYNKEKCIYDEDALLNKIISDFEVLNIHRTTQNCLTLLKASERYFDENPVNRTKMLEMVLFVLFNDDEIPTYKSKPDLKDCEFVLGKFCENMIRNDKYVFSKEFFIDELKNFCKDKLIELDNEFLFEILSSNHIIIKNDSEYIFKSSFWIFYFGAKRMHIDKSFSEYIFNSKKYIHFPEIIEFYTGIDRNRDDALETLRNDTKDICDIVFDKIGLPDNINPYIHAQWIPTEDSLEKMTNEIGENVANSLLPDVVKDQFADRDYNQIRPYNQSINYILEKYSLLNLIQNTRAVARALRNSDYVDPIIKKNTLKEILRSWEQLSKVLFALTPILASKGTAEFEGAGFILSGDFGDTVEERIKTILFVNPTNVVGMFKNDIYSNKIGPLLYEILEEESNPIKKHYLAILIIIERPKDWDKIIENYIVNLNKNSFFLLDTVNALRTRYKFDFVDMPTLKKIEYLIKMGLAKHNYGGKKPRLDQIVKISNQNLPEREK